MKSVFGMACWGVQTDRDNNREAGLDRQRGGVSTISKDRKATRQQSNRSFMYARYTCSSCDVHVVVTHQRRRERKRGSKVEQVCVRLGCFVSNVRREAWLRLELLLSRRIRICEILGSFCRSGFVSLYLNVLFACLVWLRFSLFQSSTLSCCLSGKQTASIQVNRFTRGCGLSQGAETDEMPIKGFHQCLITPNHERI